jgi:hypothetical protein
MGSSEELDTRPSPHGRPSRAPSKDWRETPDSQEPDDDPAALRDPERLVRRRRITVLRRGSRTDHQRSGVRRSTSSRGTSEGSSEEPPPETLTKIGAPKSSSPGPWGTRNDALSGRSPRRALDPRRDPEGSHLGPRARVGRRKMTTQATWLRRAAKQRRHRPPGSRELLCRRSARSPGLRRVPRRATEPAAELIGPSANRSSLGFPSPTTSQDGGSDLCRSCLPRLCYASRFSQPLDVLIPPSPPRPCFVPNPSLGLKLSEASPSQ